MIYILFGIAVVFFKITILSNFMKINLNRLKQDLSAQTFKNDLVSNNLANINTIGYKRDILFTDMLDVFDTNDEMSEGEPCKNGGCKEVRALYSIVVR